jgi:SAM-dependent methyltransferase
MSSTANISHDYLKDSRRVRSSPVNDSDFWDERASSFAAHASETGYAERFLKIMDPEPEWTVLDMACAGGTLAIPLAERVKKITAVDFSRNMLSVLKRRCVEHGITNIDIIHGRWEDDWKALAIEEYDVAIASRSLLAEDVPKSIKKLCDAARKRVYIATSVADGPFDRRMFDVIGRDFYMGPDYIYYYNLLYEMGIRANIAFIPEHHEHNWVTHEEALDAQRWMFKDLTRNENEKLKTYLKENLSYREGRWWLPYERPCFWAVMWWDKE